MDISIICTWRIYVVGPATYCVMQNTVSTLDFNIHVVLYFFVKSILSKIIKSENAGLGKINSLYKILMGDIK